MPLLQTVERLLDALDPLFDRIEWINLGGGYLFSTPHNQDALTKPKQGLDPASLRRPLADTDYLTRANPAGD